MANQFVLTSKVARAFLLLLKNQLVMGRLTSSRFAGEFGNRGEQIGDTITVKRPPAFIVSDGPAFVNQDAVIGSAQIRIDKQRHVALTWTDLEKAINVENSLEDEVLNAKMAALAQDIDTEIMKQVLKFASWVGTPGELIKSAAGFFAGPQRLDELAVPRSGRKAVLSPADWWSLAGFFTNATNFDNATNRTALERAQMRLIGDVQPAMSQSVIRFMTGTRPVTGGLVAGAGQNVSYASVKDSLSQTLTVDTLGAGVTVKAGDVFTINGVFAVNPRTRQALPFLREFVVLEDAVADGLGAATLTISPAIIIPSGTDETLRTNTAFQTVSAAPADNAPITFKGAPGVIFDQNAIFHETAIETVYVQPPRPASGQFSFATDEQTGISIRLWADSNIMTDTHPVRADVIFGTANLDPRLGTRLSGTA